MKKNTFKRVLAGSLALLTVAAYMPANVGGLIQTSLVANADATDPATKKETVPFNFSEAKDYITSLKIGDQTYTGLTIFNDSIANLTGNTAITLDSKVPLTITDAKVASDLTLKNRKLTIDAKKLTFATDVKWAAFEKTTDTTVTLKTSTEAVDPYSDGTKYFKILKTESGTTSPVEGYGTIYQYGDVYYVPTIDASTFLNNLTNIKPFTNGTDGFVDKIKANTGVKFTYDNGFKLGGTSTVVTPTGTDSLTFTWDDATANTLKTNEKATDTGTGTVISSSDYLDILLVDAAKYHGFDGTKFTGTNTSTSNTPAATVMNEVLEAANYPTDATFTSESKFVVDADSGFTYLLVKFNPKETKNSNGTYTYNFTVPNVDNDITAAVIQEAASVRLFENEKNRTDHKSTNAGTSKIGTTDVEGDDGKNSKWQNLKFVSAEDTDPTPTNLINSNAAISKNVDIVPSTTPASGFDVTGAFNTADLTIGSTIKVTNDEPFAIYIDDGGNGAMDIPDVSYVDGKFVAEFVMPKYAGGTDVSIPDVDQKVRISLVEVTETYTYKKSADLTTLTATGKYVTNAEAASIKVKSYDANSTASDYFPASGTDKGTDVDSTAVEYGKDIVVKLAAGKKFIDTTNTDNIFVEVKKGTDTLTAGTDYTFDSTYSLGNIGEKGYALLKLDDAKSGTYKVSFKVKTADGPYILEKTFTVDAKGNITTDNVTLKFKVFKDNVQIKKVDKATTEKTAVGLEDIISDAANIKTSGTKNGTTLQYDDAWYEVKCAAGKTVEVMLTKEAKELMTQGNYQFKVSAAVTDRNGVTLNDSGENAQFEIEGRTTISDVNKDYTIGVRILDPEYGGSETADTIDIPWKVVDYDSKPLFKPSDTVIVAQDDVATLDEAILNAVATNDAAKALTVDDVSFEYVAGKNGADRAGQEDELDSFESGLPTEKGDYTVYLSHDGEIKSTVTVTITSYKVTIEPDASALAFTYGKDFAADKYTLKDANNKVVKNVTISDLSVQFMQPIYEKNASNKDVQTGKYEEYGKTGSEANTTAYLAEVRTSLGYKATDDSAITSVFSDSVANKAKAPISVDDLKNQIGKLEAGTYYVRFSGKTSNEDYALDTSTVYEVTVSRKKLSDSTVNILINPTEYTGKSQYPTQDSITALDTETGYKFTKVDPKDDKKEIKQLKLTESFSASKVGEYDVEVGLVDANTRNYEGTATAKWHVVNKVSDINMNLKWNETKTTLFDNGRIHVEVTKKDISKLNLGDGVTIEKYGVIVEKEGKIPAPKDYNSPLKAEKDAAETQLKLNNGFIEGKYTQDNINVVDEKTGKVIEVRNAESVTYSANIKVIDAETGIWARPYVLLSDGTVAYGDAKYLNLENEAQDKLNLTMPYAEANDVFRVSNMTDAQKKDAKNYVNAGYDVLLNKYYAYATFTDLSNEGFRDTVLEVSDFGVVVDKYGIIKNDDDAAKNLRIGKNSKLIVGHYQKGNKNLQGDNEYTANITPANSTTGVWVRPYLDLGGGLIVYGDAKYFASASDYFNNVVSTQTQVQSIKGIDTLTVEGITNSPKATVKFAPNAQLKTVQERVTAAYVASVTGNKAKDAPTVTIKQVGVVLDKKGLLTADKKWTDTDISDTDSPLDAATKVYPTANANLILGKGFIEGKKTSNFTVDYTGKVSPVSNDLVVRNYVIYAIGDTELTVYGKPMAYEYNAASKKWNKVNPTA